MKNLEKDELLWRSKSLMHLYLYFSCFQLSCAHLYTKSEKYLSVEVMLVMKSNLISKADLQWWLYVNVGKCASVVLIVTTWFMSDALKILKDLWENSYLFSHIFIVVIQDEWLVNVESSMCNCRWKKLTVNKTCWYQTHFVTRETWKCAWQLLGLCKIKYVGNES